MMWSGPPCCDQFVTNAPREGEIGDRAMQVSKLATSDPELDTTKAVLANSHACPGGDVPGHRLLRRGRIHRLSSNVILAFGRHHLWCADEDLVLLAHRFSPLSLISSVKSPSSSALEVKRKSEYPT